MTSIVAETGTLASGRTAVGEVAVLHWPSEAGRRRRLADTYTPCLLVVARGDDPPSDPGPLEDWLREPIDPLELDVRVDNLERLARAHTRRPRMDHDGLLWCADDWVVVPPAQVPVARLLVERLGRVVRTAEISAAILDAGSSPDDAAMRSGMRRLAARLAPAGLALRCVRGRGYVLDAPTPEVGLRTSPSR